MMHTIADIAIILGQTPELSLVVKMTIAAVLGLAVVRFARAARASVRHLVLTSTFAALLALPIAMLIAPAVAIELPWTGTLANDAASADADGGAVLGARAGTAANADGRAARLRTTGDANGVNDRGTAEGGAGRGLLGGMGNIAGPWLSQMPWIAMLRAVWLAGATLLLGMLAIGLFRLRAMQRNGLPWLERRDEAARVARESGVRRPVTVMLHEDLAAPVTCGWRNPVILFPADARTWSDGDVRRVLLHELEHVRRGDWMVQLAARVTCAIYWFHPLVWTAWRQLCLEAERTCDDAVVRSEAGTDYAEQLVLLARRMAQAPAPPMVAMASRGDLSTRVTALLDQRQNRGRAGVLTFVAAVSSAAFIVVAIAPLRAVAAVGADKVDAQAGSASARDGRGVGKGAGTGTGSGAGMGSGVGTGSGVGAGSGTNAGVGAGVAGGVAGGVSGGIAGGVSGGVAGGAGEQAVADERRRVSRTDRALGEALIEAADDGDIQTLKELLAAGVDVNLKVGGDGSALIAASRKGEIAAIRFLLERGADVNMGVDGDGNPLIMAAANGFADVVTLLLERGADVNLGVTGDGNPLIMAAANGHADVVTLLLERGASIDLVIDGDENALIQAAGNGHLDVVKLLVARGANVNARVQVEVNVDGRPTTEWRTPLSMARRGRHAAVVAFLQSAGAVE
jgi:beta-lactamase regulating signal transducer with metallopeptidase domain